MLRVSESVSLTHWTFLLPVGLAGSETLLPGYPDSPYNPNRGVPDAVTNFTTRADDIYRQVRKLVVLFSYPLLFAAKGDSHKVLNVTEIRSSEI